ncbi:MAG TPA: hypothetical protein EYQ81_16220 [Sneathiellales bacterium]|nr:hypothetical protein [Sneathiellales bacterium]
MTVSGTGTATGAGAIDGWPRVLLWLIGVVTILNGAGMYVAPESWFNAVPGVAETGPFNGHFVRDVGAAYAASGVAVILAVQIRAAQLPLLIVASIFSGGHALRHVVEWGTVEGARHNWANDAIAVVLPSAIILIATAVAWRDHTTES